MEDMFAFLVHAKICTVGGSQLRCLSVTIPPKKQHSVPNKLNACEPWSQSGRNIEGSIPLVLQLDPVM